MSTEQGKKFDSSKLRYDLLPLGAVNQLAAVLTHGVPKYGERNWEQGIEFSRLYAAAQRHLQAWFAGEDLDPESGLSHLAHAMFGVSALLEFVARGNYELDNRPSWPLALPMTLSADNSRIDPETRQAAERLVAQMGGVVRDSSHCCLQPRGAEERRRASQPRNPEPMGPKITPCSTCKTREFVEEKFVSSEAPLGIEYRRVCCINCGKSTNPVRQPVGGFQHWVEWHDMNTSAPTAKTPEEEGPRYQACGYGGTICPVPAVPGTPSPMDENDCGLD